MGYKAEFHEECIGAAVQEKAPLQLKCMISNNNPAA